MEIRNTGTLPGKEVLQLYVSQPKGKLEKAKRVLIAFGKTKTLKPGQAERVKLVCDKKYLSSYDESQHAFILKSGEYH